MARLIDADAILTKFDKTLQLAGNDGAIAALKFCKEIVQKATTISPDEVRGVGEWTNKRTIEHDGNWWCTTCGKEITIYMGKDRKDRYAFCPNCGAKMEVSEDA